MFQHTSIENPPDLCISTYVFMQEINKPRQIGRCENTKL